LKDKKIVISRYVSKNSVMVNSILNKRDLLKYNQRIGIINKNGNPYSSSINRFENHSIIINSVEVENTADAPQFLDVIDAYELKTYVIWGTLVIDDKGVYYLYVDSEQKLLLRKNQYDEYMNQCLLLIGRDTFVLKNKIFNLMDVSLSITDYQMTSGIVMNSFFYISISKEVSYGKVEIKLNKKISYLKINNDFSIDNNVLQLFINGELLCDNGKVDKYLIVLLSDKITIEVYKKNEKLNIDLSGLDFYSQGEVAKFIMFPVNIKEENNSFMKMSQNIGLNQIINYVNSYLNNDKTLEDAISDRDRLFLLSPIIRLNAVFQKRFDDNIGGFDAAYISAWRNVRGNISTTKPKGRDKIDKNSIINIHERFLNNYDTLINKFQKASAIRSLFYGYSSHYSLFGARSKQEQEKYEHLFKRTDYDLSTMWTNSSSDLYIPIRGINIDSQEYVTIVGYDRSNTKKIDIKIYSSQDYICETATYDSSVEIVNGKLTKITLGVDCFFDNGRRVVDKIRFYHDSLKGGEGEYSLFGWMATTHYFHKTTFNYLSYLESDVKIPYPNPNSVFKLTSSEGIEINDGVKVDIEASIVVLDKGFFWDEGSLLYENIEIRFNDHTILSYYNLERTEDSDILFSIWSADDYLKLNLNELIEKSEDTKFITSNSVRFDLMNGNSKIELELINGGVRTIITIKSTIIKIIESGKYIIESDVVKVLDGSIIPYGALPITYYDINTGEILIKSDLFINDNTKKDLIIKSYSGILVQYPDSDTYPMKESARAMRSQWGNGEKYIISNAMGKGSSSAHSFHSSLGSSRLHSENSMSIFAPYQIFKKRFKIKNKKRSKLFYRKFKVMIVLNNDKMKEIRVDIQHPFGKNIRIVKSRVNWELIIKGDEIVRYKKDWIEIVITDATLLSSNTIRNKWLDKIDVNFMEL